MMSDQTQRMQDIQFQIQIKAFPRPVPCLSRHSNDSINQEERRPDGVGMAKEENVSRRQKLQWNHMDAFSSRVDDDERAERYVEKILKRIEKKRAYEHSLKRLSMLERDTGDYQTNVIPSQGRFEEEIGKHKACKCQSYDNFQMEAKLTIPNEDIPKNATLREIQIE